MLPPSFLHEPLVPSAKLAVRGHALEKRPEDDTEVLPEPDPFVRTKFRRRHPIDVLGKVEGSAAFVTVRIIEIVVPIVSGRVVVVQRDLIVRGLVMTILLPLGRCRERLVKAILCLRPPLYGQDFPHGV